MTNMPEQKCETCGQLLDAVTHVNGPAKPSPGDLSICVYCGTLTVFNNELRRRALTGKEMIAAAGDVRVLAIQTKIRLHKAMPQ